MFANLIIQNNNVSVFGELIELISNYGKKLLKNKDNSKLKPKPILSYLVLHVP